MPGGKGPRIVAHIFYDRDGEKYPFYAGSRQEAVQMAVKWARKRGLTLYQKKSLSS